MSGLTLGLSARDRRTAVVGLVVMGSIVGVGRGWPAARVWQAAQQDAVTALRDSVADAERLAVLEPAYRANAQRTEERVAMLDSAMIGAVVPAAAAASLASLLRESVTAAGMQLTSITVTSDSAWVNGLARVQARVLATGDVKTVTTLLADVEGSPALLLVREMSIGQPDPMAPRSRPEQLRLELAVTALARERSNEPEKRP